MGESKLGGTPRPADPVDRRSIRVLEARSDVESARTHPGDFVGAGVLLAVPLLQLHAVVKGSWLSAGAVVAATRWAVLAEHNHSHVPLARQDSTNELLDHIAVMSSGLPVPFYRIQHVANHHRFNGESNDWTSPFTFAGCQYPDRPVSRWRYVVTFAPRSLGKSWRWCKEHPGHRWSKVARRSCRLYLPWLAFVAIQAVRRRKPAGILATLGPPILVALGAPVSNWRQHVDDAGYTTRDHQGLLSQSIGFNIGYHRAHHAFPSAHWSRLPELSQMIDVDEEPGVVADV